jgi:lysozyme family protein
MQCDIATIFLLVPSVAHWEYLHNVNIYRRRVFRMPKARPPDTQPPKHSN